MNLSDLSWVMNLDLRAMDYPWEESMWRDLRNINLNLYFYLDKSGYCLFEKSDVFHIYKLVIDPKFRRLGLARELIEQLKVDAQGKSIYLEVSDQNEKAVKFYNSLGFEQLFHQKKFYSDGTGCFKMTLNTP